MRPDSTEAFGEFPEANAGLSPVSQSAGGSPVLFPSFFRVRRAPGVNCFEKRPLSPDNCRELLLIDKVVCPRRNCEIADIAEARKGYRALDWDGVQMHTAVCQSCYAAEACMTGKGLEALP